MMIIKLNSIGKVFCPVTERIDENWGSVISDVIINKEYSDGLIGLEKFSHAIIIFYMHKSSFDKKKHLIRTPQGRKDLPNIGIFAQRAKHRPNPIGVTAVEVMGVKENVIKVKGLDAIDGTPVLDIKPYFPSFDSRDAIIPKWVNKLMKKYF